MNARDNKIFRANHYYHIYNRGNNREKIFLDKQDYLNFLKRLAIVMGKMPIPNAGKRNALKIRPFNEDSFSVIAYCLMPNHFHILMRQDQTIPISQLMIKVCTSYARYFNHKYKRVGNIFQDTFKAKVIETDEYLSYLSAYIHNNPAKPFSYEHSSLPDYLLLSNRGLCDTKMVLDYFKGSRVSYKNFVRGFSHKQELEISDLIFNE